MGQGSLPRYGQGARSLLGDQEEDEEGLAGSSRTPAPSVLQSGPSPLDSSGRRAPEPTGTAAASAHWFHLTPHDDDFEDPSMVRYADTASGGGSLEQDELDRSGSSDVPFLPADPGQRISDQETARPLNGRPVGL